MKFRVVPLAVGAAAGALDGAVGATDANASPQRAAWTKQRGTFVQGGLIAAGALGLVTKTATDASCAALNAGVALAARHVAFQYMGRNSTPPLVGFGATLPLKQPERPLSVAGPGFPTPTQLARVNNQATSALA